MFPGPGDPKELSRYLALGQVGLEMVAPIVLGLVLDSYLGWSPWGVAAGVAIGFIGGLAHLVTMTKPQQRPKPSQPAPPANRTEREGTP